jgi:regulator of replication initiation timing
VKLSVEEVQVYKENANKDMCEGVENRYEELLLKRIVAMADTIEAQQLEIEQLKKAVGEWKYEAECHMDEVIASKKENEKLKAILTDAVAEIDAIEMSDDTGISDSLYERMRAVVEPDVAIDVRGGNVRTGLRAEIIQLQTQLDNRLKYVEEGNRAIEILEEQKKQLQAHAAAMRQALMELKGTLCNNNRCAYEYCKPSCEYYSVIGKARKALSSDAGKDYHNPADVEALKLAKGALKIVSKKHSDLPHHEKYPRTSIVCSDTIKTIDKALGGDTP